MKPPVLHKVTTFEEYQERIKKEIKELGYEEVLTRMAWNLTILMNKEKNKA